MILAFFILGPFVLLCFLAYGYRYRARTAEARANRAEGALDESRSYAETMRDLALRAIGAAAEKHFPSPGDVSIEANPEDDVRRIYFEGKKIYDAESKSAATYASQVVANCSNCNVSVRHEADKYPVPCPACKTLIDPVLDNPPEL